ncbi:MAG: hypothetical protein IJV31_08710 [Clostridia bacterium]|nr:hypothetical protein [Clostridia bacterium]
MEKKAYEILGIKQYKKFVIFCKKNLNKITKNKDNNDNYFLKGYKKEDIKFLKENLNKNLKIHLFGVLIGLIVIIIGEKIEYKIIGIILLIWNLYSVMLQRYNIIRIDTLKTRK